MADGAPNLGDLFGVLGGANPIAAVGKTIEQFRRTIDDLMRAVEVFTETMDTMNQVAGRVNRLMDDIEEPIRAAVPQITGTIRAAESLVDQLTSPIERVVPLLGTVADTLSAPAFGKMPQQLGEFLDVLGDVTERLAPLTGLLESAGGLFRNNPLRSVLGAVDLSPARPSAPPPPPPPPPAPTKAARAKAAPAKPAPATKQQAAKAAAAKQPSATKKAAAQKTPAKKAPRPRPR